MYTDDGYAPLIGSNAAVGSLGTTVWNHSCWNSCPVSRFLFQTHRDPNEHPSEWFMGVAAIGGYENANGRAMDLWEAVYPNVLLVALTDTFSTMAFYKVCSIAIFVTCPLAGTQRQLQDFAKDPERANRWTGLRQDSGDPFVYAPRARDIYRSMGIDHTTKVIIYSDSLNVDKALALKKQCEEVGFTGTWLLSPRLSLGVVIIGIRSVLRNWDFILKRFQVAF